MSLLFAFIPALLGLFLWMYLLTYFMYRGASKEFFTQARLGFLRGMIVAAVFIIFDSVSFLQWYIEHDWIVFPILFFLFTLPFSWRRIGKASFIPLILGAIVFIMAILLAEKLFFWSPFHEEIGKWYQGTTSVHPGLLSPFVSLGFSFVENIRYYQSDISVSQIIGRNLFSLPLHIFASLLAFYCFFALRSRLFGAFLGLLAAISLHSLYNWSLSTSMILTLIIMMGGYAFYGWSLENGWWKKKI